MVKLIEWEYHYKLWIWNHLGWWSIALPFMLYGFYWLYLLWYAKYRYNKF